MEGVYRLEQHIEHLCASYLVIVTPNSSNISCSLHFADYNGHGGASILHGGY